MRDINLIVIHCADTPPSMDIGADEIRKWHTEERGWSDIGYHHVIRRNGTIEPGRPESRAGAHARGHNADSVGICLVGGKGEPGSFDDHFTTAQKWALKALLAELGETYPGARVRGHADLDSGKTCPSFDVGQLLATW